MTPPSLLAPCCCVLLLSPCFLPHVTLSSPHCCHVSHHCCCDSTVTLLLLISSLPCVSIGILLSLCSVSPFSCCCTVLPLYPFGLFVVTAVPSVIPPLSHVATVIVPLLSCVTIATPFSPCCPTALLQLSHLSHIAFAAVTPSSSLPPSLSSHGPPVVCDDDITIISLQSVRCHPVVLCCHHNCPLVVLCVTVITPCPLFPHFILALPRPVSALPSGSVLSLVELST